MVVLEPFPNVMFNGTLVPFMDCSLVEVLRRSGSDQIIGSPATSLGEPFPLKQSQIDFDGASSPQRASHRSCSSVFGCQECLWGGWGLFMELRVIRPVPAQANAVQAPVPRGRPRKAMGDFNVFLSASVFSDMAPSSRLPGSAKLPATT